MKRMGAGQFKNTCLAVMDEVQKSGEAVLVTKHGKPVVKVVPAAENGDDIFDRLAGKAKVLGDIVYATDEDWETQ